MKRITGLLVGLFVYFCIGFFFYVIIISENPVSDLIGDRMSVLIIATLGLLIISVITGVAVYFLVVRQLEKIETERDSSRPMRR